MRSLARPGVSPLKSRANDIMNRKSKYGAETDIQDGQTKVKKTKGIGKEREKPPPRRQFSFDPTDRINQVSVAKTPPNNSFLMSVLPTDRLVQRNEPEATQQLNRRVLASMANNPAQEQQLGAQVQQASENVAAQIRQQQQPQAPIAAQLQQASNLQGAARMRGKISNVSFMPRQSAPSGTTELIQALTARPRPQPQAIQDQDGQQIGASSYDPTRPNYVPEKKFYFQDTIDKLQAKAPLLDAMYGGVVGRKKRKMEISDDQIYRNQQRQRKKLVSGIKSDTRGLNAIPIVRDRGNLVKNYSQMLQTQSTYGFNQAGYLQSFPQWIAKQNKRAGSQLQGKMKQLSLVQGIANASNDTFIRLSALDPNLARWDAKTQTWIGDVPEKTLKGVEGKSDRLLDRNQLGAQLLNQKLSQQEAIQAVPPMIMAIVQANDNLSVAGIGKISENSSPLYAGRWLDTQTGNVRVLPTANSKYINPSSLVQKMGYLQAKMINHWNNLVSTYDQQQKLSNVTERQYAKKVAKSIQSGLDLTGLVVKNSNTINRRIQAFFINPQVPSMQGRIMRSIGAQQLGQIYKVVPGIVVDSATTRADRQMVDLMVIKGKMWQSAVQQAQQRLSQLISRANVPQQYRQRLQIQLNRSVLRLVSGPARSVANTTKKLAKIAFIPDDLDQSQVMALAQNFDEAVGGDQKLITDSLGTNYTPAEVINLQELGKDIAAVIKQKDGAYNPTMAQYYKDVVEQMGSGGRAQYPLKTTMGRSMKDVRKLAYGQ